MIVGIIGQFFRNVAAYHTVQFVVLQKAGRPSDFPSGNRPAIRKVKIYPCDMTLLGVGKAPEKCHLLLRKASRGAYIALFENMF